MKKSVVLALLSLWPLAQSHAAGDPNASCKLPFERIIDTRTGRPFPIGAAQNLLKDMNGQLRLRYIVGDFNTADANGMCRGIQESFSPASALSDFVHLKQMATWLGVAMESLNGKSLTDLAQAIDHISNASAQQAARASLQQNARELEIELGDLANYTSEVAHYATKPVHKGRVDNGYCIGENLSYCEIKNPKFDANGELVGGEPTLVYRFVTSTSRTIPPAPDYYSPINIINTRHWSSDRNYTTSDADRDLRLGGGLKTLAMFHNGGSPEEMPNFLNFIPPPGYKGETQNGIHEIAGGLDSGGRFGAPVSLGCVRLNKFQAKLSRWWTPQNARFFIYLDPSRYVQHGDAATGRALP